MTILIGIAAGAVALIVGALWLIRMSRRQAADAAQALAAMAGAMGTTWDPAAKAMQGTTGGRVWSIHEGTTYGKSGTGYFLRIRVAVKTSVTLELMQQSSDLGARLVNDVAIGDPEFDKWFIVRTNDVAKVQTALTSDLRRRFIDWLRSGNLSRVRIADDQLHYEGGRGLSRKADVERAHLMLESAIGLAAALE